MKYYLWVLGCAMNNSDAERIATVLELLGYKKTEKESDADIIITVACSVRQTAIDRIYGKAKVWKKLKTKNLSLKTILTGCVLESDRKKMASVFDAIIEIEEMGKLPGLIADISGGENVEKLGKSGEYLSIKPSYQSSFRAYVPIMTGCNNFCSYCAVPYTRGREKSRKPEDVIGEIENLFKSGYKEITLLGQNVNSYQFGFVELLKLIDEIPGDYRVYFYSNHPKDMSDELINLLPNLKHFPAYIHLPLQSGSNRILKEMNRHYTKESYLELVAKIKKSIPNVTLTTDIIVGYPSEIGADFEDTKEVMEKAGFDMAFIAQYSPRSGAKSAKLVDDVAKKDKIARDKKLVEILAKTVLENNSKLENTTQRVLIDGQKGGRFYGRTEGYKVVEIKTDQSLEIGQFYDVKVENAGSWKLICNL